MASENVEDIAHQLPQLSYVLIPGFFNRVRYPLLIFRELLFLHGSNLFASEFMNFFNLSPRDMKSSTLKENNWFLLFLGAEVVEINDFMAQHKKQKEQLNAIASPARRVTNGNSRFSDLGTPPVGATPIGDAWPGLSIEDPVTHHARALSNDSARA